MGQRAYLGVLDKELRNEVPGLWRHRCPLCVRKFIPAFLDRVEEELLTGVARLPLVPTTSLTAVARERGVTAEQYVGNDS